MNHQAINSPSASSPYSEIPKLAEDIGKTLLSKKSFSLSNVCTHMHTSTHTHTHMWLQVHKPASQQSGCGEGKGSLKAIYICSKQKKTQKNKTAHKD